MKKIIILALLSILAGCAGKHAEIEAPVVMKVVDEAYTNKTLSYQIMYSQPEPGVFSGGEQQPMVPIEEAKLSIASASTLRNLPDYIFEQLPSSVTRADLGSADFNLVVEITAHDKKGPAYADYNAGESFAKNFITLGIAAENYEIIADFDAIYKLYNGDEQVFEKEYIVDDNVDHQRGDLESFNSLNDYAGELLEKHLIITLNDFFNEAKTNI